MLSRSARALRGSVFAVLVLGAAPPEPPRGPRPPPAEGRLTRVDRMWLVGAAAEDRPGLYLHAADGKLHFVLRGPADGRLRVVQWSLRSAEPVRLVEAEECRVAARGRAGVVLAARTLGVPARCVVAVEGDVTVEQVRHGRRAFPFFAGPTARRAGARLRVVRERR